MKAEIQMAEYLGIDTSNYTTSCAVYESSENKIIQQKKLLPVKEGQLGLRQSDAVFHHTKQLPEMIEKLFQSDISGNICCVSASSKPRNAEGSYMPCFLCGEGFARSYSAIAKIPFYSTSHQTGHILSALYSAGHLDFTGRKFIAFHVSGGTTDCLLCEPDSENIINISQISSSLDLKAGQAVDRIGLMLGLKFPCGRELEKLAVRCSEPVEKIKPVLKGIDCSLSGLENKCNDMLEKGFPKEYIARFCLEFIAFTVSAMTEKAVEKFGNIPVVYAGGVMSDIIIQNMLSGRFEAYFAKPEFSCDNASGTALYGFFKSQKK